MKVEGWQVTGSNCIESKAMSSVDLRLLLEMTHFMKKCSTCLVIF